MSKTVTMAGAIQNLGVCSQDSSDFIYKSVLVRTISSHPKCKQALAAEGRWRLQAAMSQQPWDDGDGQGGHRCFPLRALAFHHPECLFLRSARRCTEDILQVPPVIPRDPISERALLVSFIFFFHLHPFPAP